MAGDIGLREASGLNEFGDIQFTAFFEGTENFQTAGFSERSEPGGDQDERFFGHWRRSFFRAGGHE
jgi:hypothetical protein